MKKILHIAILLCFTIGVNAQVVTPLGYGLPYAPEQIAKYNDGIAAVYVDADEVVQLQVWNGDFWYQLETPPLPLAGSNSMGYLEIKDLVQLNGDLFLLAEHTLDLMPNAPNYVLQWDGVKWTNLADNSVNDALVLHKLIIQDDEIQLVGIFSGDTANYNILYLNNSTWDYKGNLITKNIANDRFRSVVSAYDKTYVTGDFTDPSKGTVSLAEWNGANWQNVSYPAFLGENASIGVFNSQLVVFGNNSFNDEKIKLKKGNSWIDITSGLEDYTIAEIKDFDQLGSELFAVGEFVDANNNTVNLMMYDGSSWSAVSSNVANISDAEFSTNGLYVSGVFADSKELNNVGLLSLDKALIVASVYNDENGNCIKDANEEWISNYPLSLKDEVDFILTDKYGHSYMPVPEKQYELNAMEYSYWQPTCSDAQLNVNEITEYSNLAFGVRKQANIKDAKIYIADNQSYVHQNGELKRAKICVSNVGSSDITNATVTFTHNSDITNFASELAYNNYDGKTATYVINLPAESETCFYVEFKTLGDQDLEMVAAVNLNNGNTDADPSNNTADLKYKTGETLINQKHCNNGSAIKVSTEYMSYKIGFKNEGSQNAVDVMIVDVLDEDISLSPKGIWYNYSHSCKLQPVQLLENNGVWQYKFIWDYKDINLPSADETGSEGFLDFKVYLKTNDLKLGEELCNQAKIYFSFKKGSFNEPIYTNTVCSQVTENGSVNPIDKHLGIEVSPIPTNNILVIKNNSSDDVDITLINTLGQDVSHFHAKKQTESTVDVSELPKGIYFMYTKGNMIQKVVIH